jgi:hypothetical protein
MMGKARAVTCAALLAAAGCSGDLVSPVQSMAVAWDPGTHAYALGPVKLSTLTSYRHLRGGAGTVFGGGSVHVISTAIATKGATVEALRRQLISSAPGEVDVAFTLSGGVAWPEDVESLQLVSAFYNLEQARSQFNNWGLQNLPAALLVAGASVSDDLGHNPLQHAEMFLQAVATHYLPAAKNTTQIPVGMNMGAMAHSLTHQAVALFAWGGAPLPPTDSGPPKDADWNTAKHAARSMTEGMADFMAAMVTQDAHWLDHSDQQDAGARALDELRCGSPEMLAALPIDDSSANATPYDPYPLGTVLAAGLWAASQAGDPDAVARGVLASLAPLRTAAQNGGGKIALADVLDAIAGATDPDVRPVVCGVLLDRFTQLTVTTLPSCNDLQVVPPSDRCTCTQGDPGCP